MLYRPKIKIRYRVTTDVNVDQEWTNKYHNHSRYAIDHVTMNSFARVLSRYALCFYYYRGRLEFLRHVKRPNEYE